ncbi:AMP-binding protein [Mycobacterium sp. HUMS_1102779]|uniref:AMP-binding protein n=1 Tax=Mycobacterium sp. HUMS_1102779 TaxID=3383487 RepID=UPI00389A34B3
MQYTSGSTGQPKGVALTHRNLLANIRAMGQAAGATTSDRFVSWLPLYHDMGLIGAWLDCMYFGVPLVVMSPQSFVIRPSRWLWAIHANRATMSAGPNFGYELCLNKIRDEEIRRNRGARRPDGDPRHPSDSAPGAPLSAAGSRRRRDRRADPGGGPRLACGRRPATGRARRRPADVGRAGRRMTSRANC